MNGDDPRNFDPVDPDKKPLSEARLAANRANAQKSTGPRTEEGKAASRLNALQHGLLSRFITIPGEDEDELDALRDGLFEHLQPVGTFEEVLVDRMVATLWRMKRAGEIEAFVLGGESELHGTIRAMFPQLSDPGQAFAYVRRRGKWMDNLMRYETTLERSLFRTLQQLQRLQTMRMGVPAPLKWDVTIAPRGTKKPTPPPVQYDTDL